MPRRMLLTALLFSTLLFPFPLSAQKAQEPGEILSRAEASYVQVTDYSCLFDAKELVRNKYYEEGNIKVKFKKPHSYYMKWAQGKEKGQEVIYSEGKYNNELQAHTGGFFSFVSVSLDPDGSIAKRKGNHPIYQLDIGYLLKLLRTNYDLHNKLQLGTIVVEGEELLKGINTVTIRADFPEGKGFYAKRIYVHFDTETSLPVRIEAYNWEDKLKERFHFSHIQLNRGFAEKDFDIGNQEYGF